MTREFRRTNAVRRDLNEIWLYVAQGGEAAADRALDRIAEAELRLIDFPERGARREALGPDVRTVIVDGRLIYYRLETEFLTILRIIDGGRDVQPQDLTLD